MEQSEQSDFTRPAQIETGPYAHRNDSGKTLVANPLSIHSELTVRDAVELLSTTSADYLPLLDSRTGEIAGVLVKPGAVLPSVAKRAPRLGGMATPLGVYLHDGVSGGGAGFFGLMLTGALLMFLSVIVEIGTGSVTRALDTTLFQAVERSSHSAAYLGPLEIAVDQVVLSIASICALLGLVRLLPLSGTHAAEHQVVHCVEQGVPLTPRYVRSMPRVHPRCGTNLLTGLVLFLTLFVVAFDIAVVKNIETADAAMIGLVVAAPVALSYWRRIGAFLQYWLATKPATDGQIASAIRAAEQVLEKRRNRGESAVKFSFLRRIWAMGLMQVLAGYGAMYEIVMFISAHWPWLAAVLEK